MTGNFIRYCSHAAVRLAWCRIVKDYVIQAGSPDNDIMTDSEWHIKGEFEENGIPNPVEHKRGALSMARDDDYDTAEYIS